MTINRTAPVAGREYSAWQKFKRSRALAAIKAYRALRKQTGTWPERKRIATALAKK